MKISVNAQTFAVSWLDILNKLPALVYISNNATKTICWCNAYMEEQTGFKLSEIKVMGPDFFKQIMHPDDFHLAIVAQRHFLHGGNMFTGCCRVRFKKAKRWKWFYGIAYPLLLEEQSNRHLLICLFMEIHHRMHTPHQLRCLFKDMFQYSHRSLLGRLTDREREVLQLLVQGAEIKHIAGQLKISFFTVEEHIKHIKRKLGVGKLSALIALGKDMGL
jgi:DNA-binding CsgD family transcriptional regulator